MSKEEYTINDRIGDTIADLRKSKGYTQEELADIFHISTSSMSHYEQGTNPVPLTMIIQIANYFNVSVDYIIGRSKNKSDYKINNQKICSDLTVYDVIQLLSKISLKHQNIIRELLIVFSCKNQ